jgi:hypothetical protein
MKLEQSQGGFFLRDKQAAKKVNSERKARKYIPQGLKPAFILLRLRHD